ncbi:MAG: hypothetical protein AABX58_05980, partial [Thermoproteota archaeon]
VSELPPITVSPSETVAEQEEQKEDQNNYLIIGIVIGIAIGTTSIFLATKKIRTLPKPEQDL